MKIKLGCLCICAYFCINKKGMKIIYVYNSEEAIRYDSKKLLSVLPKMKDSHGEYYDEIRIDPVESVYTIEDRNSRPFYHKENWISGMRAGGHPTDVSSGNFVVENISLTPASKTEPVSFEIKNLFDQVNRSTLLAGISGVLKIESSNNEKEVLMVINEPMASDVTRSFLYPVFGREDEYPVVSRLLVIEDFPAVCLFFTPAKDNYSENMSVCYAATNSSGVNQDMQVSENVFSKAFLNQSQMRVSILAIISSLRGETEIHTFTSCVEYGNAPATSYRIGETISQDNDMSWAGDGDMRNMVEKSNGKKSTYGAYCQAPALIIDLNRMAVIGFTSRNSMDNRYSFLLDEHHHAIRWADQSDIRKDSDYRRWATRLNNNLESWCRRVENMATAFSRHCHMTLEEKAFLSESCCDQIIESRKPRKSKDNGICLDPVGFNMQPYLDRMVEMGYLERVQMDLCGDKDCSGYRKTNNIENYHVVLFAYLMNAKIASKYAELEELDPVRAKEWMLRYDRHGWNNNKEIGDVSGKGSAWIKDRKGWSYRTAFFHYEIIETRQIRNKYFSRLLSVTEEDLRTLKSHAINTMKFTLVSRDIVELVKKVDDELESQRISPELNNINED